MVFAFPKRRLGFQIIHDELRGVKRLDAVLGDSRALTAELPHGTFLEIEKRHHFNTPGARQFREAGIEFLLAGSE